MRYENIIPEAWIPKVIKQQFLLLGSSLGTYEHRDSGLQGTSALSAGSVSRNSAYVLINLHRRKKTIISALNLKMILKK